MANNSRVSRSASIEDLREKNAQMEAEISKLAEEVREVVKKQAESSKKQDESLKRQEESQRRLEESNRIMDGKLGSLSQMLERAIHQFSGQPPDAHGAETSNVQANKGNGERMSRNMGARYEERSIEDDVNPAQVLNSEELNWAETQVRNRERGVRTDNRRDVQLPKMEFPYFNGSDPKVWRAKCEHYFDIYEIPDVYKTRMALINFSEDVHEWYSCVVSGGSPLPWELLVEEVLNQYQDGSAKDPVLAMPNFDKPFILETDASANGIGAVLMQDRRPIAYMSKSLGVKNQGLSTYEKEFLALLTAVQKWRHYLIGGPFIIRTD